MNCARSTSGWSAWSNRGGDRESAFIRGHPRFPMTDPAVRLDKWLWAARFFKTRSLAQQAIRGGKIEINGDKPKASRLVRVDDRLRIGKGEWLIEVDVLEVGEKRVSAPLAREMYRETGESRQRREAIQAQRQIDRTRAGDPGKRPDKHSRRALRRIHRGD